MIITFLANGEPFSVQVTSDRVMFWKGRLTNDSWVEYDKLASLSNQNKVAVELTSLIVRSLPTKEDVAKYIIYELGRVGLQHVGTKL